MKSNPKRNFMRVLLLTVLILGFSCSQREDKAVQPDISKTDSIKVFILKSDSVKKSVSFPGELLSLEKVLIRAKLSGYIKKLNVDIGSKVKKGQVLAMIDAPEVNTQVQELNAKVQSAKAKFASSKDYFDRINTAYQKKGVIAPNEWQRTKNQMLADSSEYQAAILSASALHQTGNYLTIVAPFNGEITQRNIEVGSYVGASGEKPLLIIENNSILRLQVEVPEIYTSAILSGGTGELTIRSLPDKKFKVKLVRKAGSIDPETRTETWEFAVPNENGLLKSGGYADVKLSFLRNTASFIAPASAVVTTLEKRFVIRVSNGITQWIDVRPGFNLGDQSEFFGDLKAGDTLVLKGNEELKAGISVKIKL
ncbi:MAG TPA: efflux RND transporter periplasmic adaptor subunit [Puia sp.]|nr:efflux RND transporter periplasmic adaptor subunit [Puia sp.]